MQIQKINNFENTKSQTKYVGNQQQNYATKINLNTACDKVSFGINTKTIFGINKTIEFLPETKKLFIELLDLIQGKKEYKRWGDFIKELKASIEENTGLPVDLRKPIIIGGTEKTLEEAQKSFELFSNDSKAFLKILTPDNKRVCLFCPIFGPEEVVIVVIDKANLNRTLKRFTITDKTNLKISGYKNGTSTEKLNEELERYLKALFQDENWLKGE
jgi:hypothetical protein